MAGLVVLGVDPLLSIMDLVIILLVGEHLRRRKKIIFAWNGVFFIYLIPSQQSFLFIN